VGLEVLLERKALRIAAELELAETLVKELTEMRVKVTLGGYEQYGAWREASTTTWCWRWRQGTAAGESGAGAWAGGALAAPVSVVLGGA
jgi:hypothetical protein